MEKQTLTHQCPTCQTNIQWTKENSFRPFCSARCQNKDYLGWANEENRIQSEPSEQWSEE